MKNRYLFLRSLFVTVVFCWMVMPALAQIPTKINIELRAFIDHATDLSQQVPLNVHGDVEQIKAYTLSHKGFYKNTFGNKAFISLPVSAIDDFSRQPFVQYIGFTMAKGQVLNDVSRSQNRVNAIHRGDSTLAMPYTGKGVVIGIIDTGGEIAHPDFLDSLGNTRIVRIWDQSYNGSGGMASGYGYGAVWDSTDINSGNCPHVDTDGHGTAVMGTACANGGGDTVYTGMAPESTIVIVESAFSSPNWLNTIADAVDYIYKVADTLNMPAVVNASLGTYFGGHDGRDDVALFIDSLLEAKRGRVMVGAAGNAGGLNFHLRHDITSDTTFTYFRVKLLNSNSVLPYDAVFYEVWSDTADFNNVRFAFAGDDNSFNPRGETNWYNVLDDNMIGNIVYDSIKNPNGDLLAPVELFTEEINGRYRMQVHMPEPDSIYPYRFMTTGSGRIDVWSAGYFGTSNMVTAPLPSSAQIPMVVNYVIPDYNQNIVSSWNCSPKVISVGNWTGRKTYEDYNNNTVTVNGTLGDIHATSSWGPARDDRVKPDVAATGQITLTSGSFFLLPFWINNSPDRVTPDGLHARNGGTSQAAPVVAGIAALMLEQCPTASYSDVLNALTGTARQDSFTQATPNAIWGYGKVDGFSALLTNVFTTTITPGNDTVFCDGDSVAFTAPSGFNYEWSTGETTQTIWVSTADSISVTVFDSAGCAGRSPTVATNLLPAVPTPVIAQVGDTLYTDPGITIQWYLNGNVIAGENDTFLVATQSGYYSVSYENAAGCRKTSDELYVSLVSVAAYSQDYRAWPNPATETFNLEALNDGTKERQVHIYNQLGQAVTVVAWPAGASQLQINTADWAPGVYLVQVQIESNSYTIRLLKH